MPLPISVMIKQYHCFVKKKVFPISGGMRWERPWGQSEQGKEPANRKEYEKDQARATEETAARTITATVDTDGPSPGISGGWTLIFGVEERIVLEARLAFRLGIIQGDRAHVDYFGGGGHGYPDGSATGRAINHCPGEIRRRFQHGIALGATNFYHNKTLYPSGTDTVPRPITQYVTPVNY